MAINRNQDAGMKPINQKRYPPVTVIPHLNFTITTVLLHFSMKNDLVKKRNITKIVRTVFGSKCMNGLDTPAIYV